jgi:hypothetical protein
VTVTPANAAAPAPDERILSIIQGYWESRALAVAVELELADLLGQGPLSVEELAAQTKTDPSSLFRMMRALESIGIFAQVSPRVFANTPVSECLRKNDPKSQWAWARLTLSAGLGQYEGWAGLLGSIRTGKCAYEQLFGNPYWQFLQQNPGKAAIFNEAMRSLSSPMTHAVTAALDWSRFPVIADIGGGIGSQLADILSAHPSCRGILFDQPDVVASATPHERVERIGGDFLQSVPAGADVYLLRWIIHDWADPEAITILDHVRRAMKPDSVVAVVEWVIPETPEPTLGKWMDLHMLAMLGGRERTVAEYGELLAKAGLELERVVPTASSLSVVIGRKGKGLE